MAKLYSTQTQPQTPKGALQEPLGTKAPLGVWGKAQFLFI